MANRPKGSDRFSRRDSVQKKPEERERYDRKNGAFKLETSPVALAFRRCTCCEFIRINATTISVIALRLWVLLPRMGIVLTGSYL